MSHVSNLLDLWTVTHDLSWEKTERVNNAMLGALSEIVSPEQWQKAISTACQMAEVPNPFEQKAGAA